MRIWQRYFVSEFLKNLLFVLILIFLLYALIDFSSRRSSLHFSAPELLIFYLSSFSKELTVLLPFSAMVACIKCVADLNQNRELIALLASGVSLKRLVRPFFLIGICLSLISLANQEYFYPKAMRTIHQMEFAKKLNSKKKTPLDSVKSTHLADNSTLLYSSLEGNSLVDVIWVRGIDDIYKIGSLSLDGAPPIGFDVDHFMRQGSSLDLVSYEKERAFPELPEKDELLFDNLVEQDELSLTSLMREAPPLFQSQTEKESGVMTSLILRLALPWINLLAIIGPLPLLVRQNRSQPLFFIFSVSLFGLVFTFLVIEAAAILGKRQALLPETAILVPFLGIFSIIFTRYILMK